MKLNKLQRYTAYCIMLAEIQNPSTVIDEMGTKREPLENGLCWLYKTLFDLNFNYDFEPILPELNKYETSDWWSVHPADWNIRKKALKQCIIETTP